MSWKHPQKDSLTNSDYTRCEGRDFIGLTIYLFNLAKTSPIDAKKENLQSAEVVFDKPGMGTQSHFQCLKIKIKSDEEIRELIQKSRIEYMTTSKYRETKMDLFEVKPKMIGVNTVEMSRCL